MGVFEHKPGRAASAMALALALLSSGCSESHHRQRSGLSRAQQTDLTSRLVLPEATRVSVHFGRPAATVSTPTALLAHPELSRALWERPPEPRKEAAALRANGFFAAAGEALVDPAVNVHSGVIRFRSAVDADAALRRIAAANRRAAHLTPFKVRAIPGSVATAGVTRLPGIPRATSYRLLFADGTFLYGEQIESLPSSEVRGKFVTAVTGLYRSVRGKLAP